MSRCFRSRRSLSVVDRPRRRTGGDKGIKCQVLARRFTRIFDVSPGCRSRPTVAKSRPAECGSALLFFAARLICLPGNILPRTDRKSILNDSHLLLRRVGLFAHLLLRMKYVINSIFYHLRLKILNEIKSSITLRLKNSFRM